jgi:hypothetical protein
VIRKESDGDASLIQPALFLTVLGDLSFLLGRKLKWDRSKREIVGDPQAQRLMGRPQRYPYVLLGDSYFLRVVKPITTPKSTRATSMAELNLDVLIENVQSEDHTARAAACDGAAAIGARAMGPLAEIAANGELEIARAARHAIQNIVYHAGRPGTEDEAKVVASELLKLLGEPQPLQS